MSQETTVFESLQQSAVIAVLVIDSAEKAEPLANALLEGGVNAMELTLRTPAALGSLRNIRGKVPGMLAGIGVLIALKQIPHALGHDSDPEGDMSYDQPDGETTFSSLFAMFEDITPAAVLISSVCLAILIFWMGWGLAGAAIGLVLFRLCLLGLAIYFAIHQMKLIARPKTPKQAR